MGKTQNLIWWPILAGVGIGSTLVYFVGTHHGHTRIGALRKVLASGGALGGADKSATWH